MTAPQPVPDGVDPTQCVGVVRAAEILGVSDRTVERWADQGLIPVAYRTRGGHRRFLASTLTPPPHRE